jgi:hypothetical protein
MASTRNKNTIGNYALEQKSYKNNETYCLYTNSQYGESYSTNLPGYGLLAGSLPRDKLSHNAVETESFLFGIGSTNLIEPKPCFDPRCIDLQQVNIYTPKKLIMPQALSMEPNRPFPCP